MHRFFVWISPKWNIHLYNIVSKENKIYPIERNPVHFPLNIFNEGSLTNWIFLSHMKIFFCGDNNQNLSFTFDFIKAELEQKANMIETRGTHALCTWNQKLYVFGGNMDVNSDRYEGEKYSIEKNKWKGILKGGKNMQNNTFATVHNDFIYINNFLTSYLLRYNPVTQDISTIFDNRNQHNYAIFMTDTQMILLG